MKHKEYLALKQEDCRNCYRCIRSCPIKAISFSDRQARILDTECMLCGCCFVSCPQHAKEIRNDVGEARQLVASGDPVVASLAPSFVAYYDGASMEAMRTALEKLGFAAVEETALGAVAVKKRYEELINEGNRKVIISSCCHSITLLLQRHFPEALPFLAPVVSPMQAHAMDIKKRLPGAKTVFIGPCISKKAEADDYPGVVDCVLTFEGLSEWLDERGIAIPDNADRKPAADGECRGKTRLFPSAGGILRSMSKTNKEYTYMHVEGVEACIRTIQDLLCHEIRNCFIEMSACEGSCIGGPIMLKAHKRPLSSFVAVNGFAGDKDFKVAMPERDRLRREFPSAPQCRIRISEAAISEVLRKTGKTKPEDELNCGTCGYDSCREKAKAVIQGKADLSMCLPYLKERAESFSDTIITNTPNGIVVLNEALEVQQVNEAACRILNIPRQEDILGSKVVRVLDPDIFVEVKQAGANVYDRRVFLAEYQRHVRMTVVHDTNYHILILIMRDVTREEEDRARNDALNWQTAEVTDQVIDKQMRVVQEIASLLGETAAETKIALTKLKESLKLE